ncbi:alginate O-acetyltransferase AlgX-related protein [Caulobacter sp. BE254]|uniref:alginate O-acetyltransferase AlgX-related protein n=1 Tax=Caulobacter sp. BE254 TaxID=2817720 RepID=UPI0028657818|nr:tetratricopeptide repeat protein [Caulobacter sp. BE254]MDR7117308.1 hypothetical protein [Caulobacter sp. BE254]
MVAGSNISVVPGKSGWLFLEAFGSNTYLDEAADLKRWSAQMLPQLVASYVARHERMKERGLPFVVVFAPETSGIYSEHLPDGRTVQRPTACEILTAELRARGVNVVCPSDALRQAKGPVDVCQRLDSHWSDFGAYIAYREIMQALGPAYAPATLAWQDVYYGAQTGYGDLGVHVSPERKGPIQTVDIPAYGVVADRNTFDVREKNLRRFVCSRGVGKALIFRDSFSNALSPFFERTFAETLLVAPSPCMMDNAIDHFAPDLVILEVAERALFAPENPFNDWSARTFAQEYLELATNEVGGRLQVQSANANMAGQADEAIALAAIAIGLEGDGRRLYNLAWALHRKDRHDLCYALTSQVSAKLQDSFIYYLQADSAYFIGKPQEAVDMITEALRLRPTQALFLYLKGEWQMQMGQVAEARDALEASLRYAPLHERTWTRLKEVCLALGDQAKAAAIHREGVRLFPNL